MVTDIENSSWCQHHCLLRRRTYPNEGGQSYRITTTSDADIVHCLKRALSAHNHCSALASCEKRGYEDYMTDSKKEISPLAMGSGASSGPRWPKPGSGRPTCGSTTCSAT